MCVYVLCLPRKSLSHRGMILKVIFCPGTFPLWLWYTMKYRTLLCHDNLSYHAQAQKQHSHISIEEII